MPDIKLMAGQRLMLGFNGTHFNDELRQIIREIKASGIILFSRNIESPDQVKVLCESCQEYAKSADLPPLFIGIDQEGGTVARLKPPFTQFKGNPYIQTQSEAIDFAITTAKELAKIGVNMNFAPVLDVAWNDDSIMNDRAFKGDGNKVSRLGNHVISTLQEKGVMAVAKHFPGIGRTLLDSHYHLPVVDLDLETLLTTDMIPFVDAIDNKVSGIMLSHILYPGIDNQWQASLSPIIANDILRNNMGYTGLVMTDDLDMKAINKDIQTCVSQILKANIDLALICHEGPNIGIAFKEIQMILETEESLYLAHQSSIDRILKYKKRYIGI
jgi:beta-N-acetylhexosaminidase